MEDQSIESIIRDINFGKHRISLKKSGIDVDKLYCNKIDYNGQKCKECKYYTNLCLEETLSKIFKY